MTSERNIEPEIVDFPAPQPDQDSHEFWEHAKSGELALQFCGQCQQYQFPPLRDCRQCGQPLVWHQVSGGGTVYSFIVQHYVVADAFSSEVPYVIALVSPDEAPEIRIPGRMLKSAEDVAIGGRVRTAFCPVRSGAAIPIFEYLGFP